MGTSRVRSCSLEKRAGAEPTDTPPAPSASGNVPAVEDGMSYVT